MEIPMKLRIALVMTGLKILLIPSYRSTDFEVHRNWLAITSSLPLAEWYTNNTSEWTLDYPPFFAWFEWVLSNAARLAEPATVAVSAEPYVSETTIIFQRASVIITDAVLLSAAWFATRRMAPRKGTLVFFLVVANPGLLMVDHMHFQYNGLLLGMLLWSVALIREGHNLLGALIFAALLNMKHLFACLGPLYFIYLLRHFCWGPGFAKRFVGLGAMVSAIFGISFGPFIWMGQLGQLLSRLFPFGRGLCHAYWAANLWALYSFADKSLAAVLPHLGIPVTVPVGHMTGGLVQVFHTVVLPDVGPRTTVLLVLGSIAPSLWHVWQKKRPPNFAWAAAFSCMCSFMAGYHVHEKAILLVTVLLALDAADSARHAGLYLYLSSLGHYAVTPLLFTRAEYPIKIAVLLAYTIAATQGLRAVVGQKAEDFSTLSSAELASWLASPANVPLVAHGPHGGSVEGLLQPGEAAVLLGIVGVELFSLLHPLLLGDRLPFLPLMLISVYCAAGLLWAWLWLGAPYLGSLGRFVAQDTQTQARSGTGDSPNLGKQGRRHGGAPLAINSRTF